MTPADDGTVRPFDVSVDRSEIDDLESRLANARWPDQLPDAGWEYGTERSYLRTLCEYWREDYD